MVRGRVPFLANGDPSLAEGQSKAKEMPGSDDWCQRCSGVVVVDRSTTMPLALARAPLSFSSSDSFAFSPHLPLAPSLSLCLPSSAPLHRISGCSEFREIVNRLLVVRCVERVEMLPVALRLCLLIPAKVPTLGCLPYPELLVNLCFLWFSFFLA